MKSISAFLCSLLSCAWLAQAQAPKVIPPSPNASAFQRYGDIPVSTYNGIPNVSIPLYDIKSGDIQFPISLSYHASGIKVADEASRVGLGWVINSGGMISRTILGGDDFAMDGSQPYHNSQVAELMAYGGPSFQLVQWGCAFTVNNTLIDYGNYDSEPDQYYFSLPGGKSGKFILKRNKAVVLENDELIDIQVIGNGDQWIIRTGEGYTYEFNVYEYELQIGQRRTAWYLTKITSPSNAKVTYKYTPLATTIQTVGSYYQERTDGNMFGSDCTLPPFSSQPTPGRNYYTQQLDSIVFDEGQIRFSYSSREDLSGDKKLETISIWRKTFDPASPLALLKSMSLQYEYFEGTSDHIGLPLPVHSKRLKLKQVVEKSRVGKTVSAYKFDYNNETGTALPSKRSFARDHWGYYNEKNNTQLVPTFSPINGSMHPGLMGDERNPNGVGALLFSLRKIWYPTGGYSEFEMESNRYTVGGSVVTPQAVSLPVYSGGIHVQSPATFSDALADGKVMDLTNISGTNVTIKLTLIFNDSRAQCPAGGGNVTMQIVRQDGGVAYTSNILDALIPQDGAAKCIGIDGDWDGIDYTRTFSLSPGKYFLRLYIEPDITYVSVVAPSYQFVEVVPANGTLPGGGIRVKRIRTADGPNATPQIARFEYAGGLLMAKPNYTYVKKSEGASGGQCEFLTRSSESGIPLARNGYSVGYSQVTKYYGENGENGKTVFAYNNESDIILFFTESIYSRKPPANSTLPNMLNGTLKSQADFRYVAPNQFDTVRFVSNNYVDYYGLFNGITWALEKRDAGYSSSDQCVNHSILYPAIKRSRAQLLSSTEKVYDNALRRVVTTVSYEYSPTHFQQTRQVRTVDGKSISTFSKYVLDYTDAECNAAMLSMKTRKYSPVIQTRTQQEAGGNQVVLSQNITTYDFAPATPIILPTAQASFLIAAPLPLNQVANFNPAATIDTLKYKIDYKLSYHSTGKIASIKPSGGGPNSYLWNSVGQPIAEVQNSLHSLSAYTSFEYSANEGNWTFSATPTIAASKSGRKFFPLSTSAFITKQLSAGKYCLEYYAKAPILITPVAGLTVTDIQASTADANGWIYYKKELTASASVQLRLTTGGTTIGIDELRLYPKAAQMTSYTYEPLIGMISATDPNGRTAYYEYNEFNQLKLIRDDNRNILKTFNYRLKDQQQ